MKCIIFRLSVALLTFTIGVATIMIWRSAWTLPYCEVARHAEQFHGKVVRVKATLIFGSDGMYIYEDCDPVSALAAFVELDGLNKDDHQTWNYVEEVLVSGEKDQVRKVDAIITGRFDGKYSTGCWGPQFHITATGIELTSPVSDYHPAAPDSESQRMRH